MAIGSYMVPTYLGLCEKFAQGCLSNGITSGGVLSCENVVVRCLLNGLLLSNFLFDCSAAAGSVHEVDPYFYCQWLSR